MRRYLVFTFVILLLVLLVYLAIEHSEILDKAWLWIVGLFGLIYSGVKSLFDFLTPGDRSLKEIEKNNNELKKRHEEIKAELKEAKERLIQERAAHAKEIERIKAKLDEQQSEYEQVMSEREKLRSMKYQDYMNTLPLEKRKEIEEEIWKEVDFGL